MLKIFKEFFEFCGTENKRKFYTSLFLGAVLALLEALRIPAIYVMIDALIRDAITNEVILTSFGIVLFCVAGGSLVRYRMTMLQTEAGYRACADKRIEIAEHMRYLPMGYFNQNSLGYITTVTTNTMENLAGVATRVVMMTTQGILNTLLITVLICLFDYRIGLMVIGGLLLFFLVNSFLQKASAKLAPLKNGAESRLVAEIIEYVQGIAEIKEYSLAGRKNKSLEQAIQDNADCCVQLEVKAIPIMSVQNLIAKGMGVLICGMSITFLVHGSMGLSECIAMMISAFIMYSSLESAGMFSSLVRVIDFSVNRAREILKLKEMDINGKDVQPECFDIDVKHASFSYEDKKIIDDLSVHIPQKTTTAIVGPSGGGKTTLCHLIARFWDVDHGCVLLGGRDVREYSMDALMKNFSFVFQNVYLFQDTIANNIRFGQPEASMEQVIAGEKSLLS